MLSYYLSKCISLSVRVLLMNSRALFSFPVAHLLLQPVFLHIWPYFPHWTPPDCIQSQDPAEHLHGFWAKPFPQWRSIFVISTLFLCCAPVCKLLVKVIWIHATFPGKVACKDAEDKHPKGPGVQAGLHTKRWCSHFLLTFRQGHGAKFWGHVGQSASDIANYSACLLGKAEVCQLHLTAAFVQYQNVFGFDITVNQPATVNKLQSTGNLKDAAFDWRFRNAHLQDTSVMQFLGWVSTLISHQHCSLLGNVDLGWSNLGT